MAVKDNSTVRWFSSDMAGAPQVDSSPGCLVSILDACLINGFGHKAPDGDKITISGEVATVNISGGHDFEKHAVIEIEGATPEELNDVWRITGTTATTFTFNCQGLPDGAATGSIIVKRAAPGFWEKALGDSLKAAYRSTHEDATGFYLRVDATNNTQDGTKVRGYESMTDIDTGDGPFPTLDQRDENSFGWRIQYSAAPYTYTGWSLIADERMLYFFPNFRYAGCAPIHYFGDVDPVSAGDFHACIIGAHSSLTPSTPTTSTTNHQFTNSDIYSSYIARQLGAAEPGEPFNIAISTLQDSVNSAIGQPIVSGLVAEGGQAFSGPAVVRSDSALRGVLPGLLKSITGGHPYLNGKKLGIVEGAGIEPVVLVATHSSSASNPGQVGFNAWGPWR